MAKPNELAFKNVNLYTACSPTFLTRKGSSHSKQQNIHISMQCCNKYEQNKNNSNSTFISIPISLVSLPLVSLPLPISLVSLHPYLSALKTVLILGNGHCCLQ